MDANVKIQLLLVVLLIGALLVSFMIIIHTIGNMNHIFNRLEEIVSKETILRLEILDRDIRIKEEQHKVENERKRRSEALLNVPLLNKEDNRR
ncbi:MAG: hypothetical protein HQK83_00470 [Fibrobacteria bacterium]|nr:hypothetical protein [Fibrobacteria bacterium]